MAIAIMTEKDTAIIEIMESYGFQDVGSGASWKDRDLEFEGTPAKEKAFLTDEDAHDELNRMVGEVSMVHDDGEEMA